MSRTPPTSRRGARLFAAALVAAVGVAAAVVGAVAAAAPDAGARAPKAVAAVDAGPPDPNARIPPDPTPLVSRKQWIFDLRYDNGDIYLLGVHQIELGAAQATPRAMGRFAIELFEGPTLIERVRYDFPMLLFGGLPLPADAGRERRFDDRLVSRIGVMFPATTRGTRLELWDRATNKRWPLPWPPADTRASAHGTDGG